jgi:predicted HicB family RNase H-like nuclease
MEGIEIKDASYISSETRKALGAKPKPRPFSTLHIRAHNDILEELRNEAQRNHISMPAMIELILVDRYQNSSRLVKELD